MISHAWWPDGVKVLRREVLGGNAELLEGGWKSEMLNMIVEVEVEMLDPLALHSDTAHPFAGLSI
jgi:hypothetical protein